MRVDSVVTSLPSLPRIDRHVIAVTKNAYEVALSHILERGLPAYRRALRSIKIASKKRIKLVISSGAACEYTLRKPIQLAAIAWTSGLQPCPGPRRSLRDAAAATQG